MKIAIVIRTRLQEKAVFSALSQLPLLPLMIEKKL
jgi:hypothetical protein